MPSVEELQQKSWKQGQEEAFYSTVMCLQATLEDSGGSF